MRDRLPDLSSCDEAVRQALEAAARLALKAWPLVDRRIAGLVSDGNEGQVTYEAFMAASLDLALRRVDAMAFLCSQGYPEEAAILGRSIFEIALSVHYASTDPEELIPAFEEYAIGQIWRYHKRAADVFEEHLDQSRMAEWLRDAKEKHEAYRSRRDVHWENGFMKAKIVDDHRGRSAADEEMAMRGFYRSFYLPLSQLAHGHVGWSDRLLFRGTQEDEMRHLIVWCAWMFVETVDATSAALGFCLKAEIESASRTMKETVRGLLGPLET